MSSNKIGQRNNYFEDLVDEEMIRLVAGNDESIIDFLMQLDQDEQRPAILSIIDKNMGLFDKIMAIMNGEYIPKATHISNVVEMLRKYVEVGEVEKKKFGEVMTPIWLVEEMLDKLPQDVWTNPDLKWLDPCNGCGIFPSIVVKRLMAGLSEWEPNEDMRYKHIMENMIYVCELQAKNMFLYLCAFDPEDTFLLNIFHGSFLSEDFDFHMKHEWGIEKFDVIIGNPPYQELKEGNKKSQAIWQFFVEKGINILIENGYFSMIHPSSWREPFGIYKKAQSLLKNKELIYLEMHSVKDGIRNLLATTSYDWYILKNSNKRIKTEIKTTEGHTEFYDVRDLEFIPNAMIEEINNLVANKDDEKVNGIHERTAYGNDKSWMSREMERNFVYPCVYTSLKDGAINILYSSTNKNGHFGIPKVFWSNGAGTSVHIDANGKYGLTNFAYGIHDTHENLHMIKKAMENEKFIKMMSLCSLGLINKYNFKIISLFRKDFWKEFVDEA
jgi:hypothetical protein